MERGAEELFGEIDNVGGVVKALESGWLQRRIAESAMRQQWVVEQHRKVVVGVNELVTEEPELTIPILKVSEDTEREQRERLAKLRTARDAERYGQAIDALRDAARTEANLIPYILDAARADATLFEIRAAMESVFGAYREPVFF
jgi:methylmalonyl-CoA mutase N-terminal domain/subunit